MTVMPSLYHLTPAALVPFIRKTGLVPAIGENAAAAGETTPAVYLFKDRKSAGQALLDDGIVYLGSLKAKGPTVEYDELTDLDWRREKVEQERSSLPDAG